MNEIAENDVLAPLAKCEKIAFDLVHAFTAVGVNALTIPVEFDGAQVDVTILVAAEPEFTAATVGHCSMPDGIATGSAASMVSVGDCPLTVLTQDVFALVKSHLHPDDSEGGYCD